MRIISGRGVLAWSYSMLQFCIELFPSVLLFKFLIYFNYLSFGVPCSLGLCVAFSSLWLDSPLQILRSQCANMLCGIMHSTCDSLSFIIILCWWNAFIHYFIIIILLFFYTGFCSLNYDKISSSKICINGWGLENLFMLDLIIVWIAAIYKHQ